MNRAIDRAAPDASTRILAAVASQPGGLSVDALHTVLQGLLPRRTLQRRLAGLVAQQRLLAQGEGRGRRYHAVAPAPTASTATTPGPALPPRATPAHHVAEPAPESRQGPGLRSPYATALVDLQLSPESTTLLAQLRRPLHQRRPVSYDTGLLEAYTPNHSFYLSEPLRAQLLSLGRSSVAPRAPAGTFARDILNRLLIDLSWASSQLEGNTYSRLDTQRLIEWGQAAEGKDALETQMILNHKAAIEFLVGDADVAVDADTVLALHALLSDGLLHDPLAGGRVRRRAVDIGGSVYKPIAVPQQLEELFSIVLEMATEITDPFEQAFFLMVHLPYLQPFEDVNKRVSRLAANIPLMRRNLCPLSFIDVPVQAYVDGVLAVYELGRTELLRDVFVWAYARSCQQYVAVKQQLVPPDLFRLRYRAEIGAAVKAIVQQGLALKDSQLRPVVPASVARADRARFIQQLRTEFDGLHGGNAIRFGLRALELAQWQQQQQQPQPLAAPRARTRPSAAPAAAAPAPTRSRPARR